MSENNGFSIEGLTKFKSTGFVIIRPYSSLKMYSKIGMPASDTE